MYTYQWVDMPLLPKGGDFGGVRLPSIKRGFHSRHNSRVCLNFSLLREISTDAFGSPYNNGVPSFSSLASIRPGCQLHLLFLGSKWARLAQLALLPTHSPQSDNNIFNICTYIVFIETILRDRCFRNLYLNTVEPRYNGPRYNGLRI